MRHHDQNRKLKREIGPRKALLRSLAEGLIEKGKIETTEAKAKELRPYIEKLITMAGKDTLASRRIVIERLGTQKRAKKLIDSIAPKYTKRAGGYTRITKLPQRKGDASKMAIIEFV